MASAGNNQKQLTSHFPFEKIAGKKNCGEKNAFFFAEGCFCVGYIYCAIGRSTASYVKHGSQYLL